MSDQPATKKPFFGVHPAYALGVVLVLALIAIFQLV